MSSSAARKRGLPERVRMRHDNHFVDELTKRGEEETVGRIVPLASVEPDANQPRNVMGDLEELTQSVRDKGVLEPLLVRELEAEDNRGTRYRIISGERRYRAALAAGLAEVPVIPMDVTDEEALEIALVENLQRKDLTPFEEADGYRALQEKFQYTQEQIARAVGKSRTVVTESLALRKLPGKVREAAEALGIHTKSLLLEVLKVEKPEEQVALLEAVHKRGLNRDDLRRQQRQSPDKSQRRQPYVFNVRPQDKRFNLSLKFKQSEVSKQELIDVLEGILSDLRTTDLQAG